MFRIVVKVNYTDNPWFPEVLEIERQHSLKTNPDYANIWEGDCKAAVDGAIYANEIREAQEDNDIAKVIKVWSESDFIRQENQSQEQAKKKTSRGKK